MVYLTIIGAAFIAWLIIVSLFTPHIPYHIEADIDATGEHFVRVLEFSCHSRLAPGNRIDILTNGTCFYPVMLDQIRRARETVSMECYIFKKGEIAAQFVRALTERARAGVRVTLVMDAIGSFGAFHAYGKELIEAGCRIERYQRIMWYRFGRLNNRTHRELLVIDGRVAFVGGAGVADWWMKSVRNKPMWRDTVARIEGPVVADLEGVAAENWLECRGEILTGPKSFVPVPPTGTCAAMVVRSSPSDRATDSRVLFQTLVEGANGSIAISTPYFLPDKAFRQAIIRTARRGVNITVIVPGHTTDQHWVRLASRRKYGELLEAGVHMLEYGGGMTHTKVLVVDDLWAVIGTTNFDNRSFEHNDEVNVVARDRGVAQRLLADFRRDAASSHSLTLAEWRGRPLWEKLVGTVAWVLERQQ